MSRPRTPAPRHHLSVKDAAARLGHSVRWVQYRIKAGDLEAFKWGPTSVTVSLESIVAFENRTRITPAPVEESSQSA